jgi:hypothetical protein
LNDIPYQKAYYRYCPTVGHLLLLLSLLSSKGREGDVDLGAPVYCLPRRPGLVILWNIAGLLLEDVELDENAQSEERSHVEQQSKRFKQR